MQCVVIGGGVAGVSCAHTLAQIASASSKDVVVTLISTSPSIKAVRDYIRITATLDDFGVTDVDLFEWIASTGLGKHLRGLVGVVEGVDPRTKTVSLRQDNGSHSTAMTLKFDKLCLCTGAAPNLPAIPLHPCVIGLRDADSVTHLGEKLKTARRIALIGNGGIALGVASEINKKGTEIVWCVRDGFIGSTFFDAGAASFFLDHQEAEAKKKGSNTGSRFVRVPQQRESTIPAEVDMQGEREVELDLAAGCSCCAGDEEAMRNGLVRSRRMMMAVDDGCDDHDDDNDDDACFVGDAHNSAEGQEIAAAFSASSKAATTDDKDDEEALEFIPTYHPLPKREKRGRKDSRRQGNRKDNDKGAEGSLPVAAALILSPGQKRKLPTTAAATDKDDADDMKGGREGRAGHFASSKRRRLLGDEIDIDRDNNSRAPGSYAGGALGPSWAQVLQRLSTAADATTTATTDATGDGKKGALNEGGQEEGKEDDAHEGRVLIELQVAVTSLALSRQQGPGGAEEGGGRRAVVYTLDPLTGAVLGETDTDSDESWPVVVTLSNGHRYSCDAVVFATGVSPLGKELLENGGATVKPWPKKEKSKEELLATLEAVAASAGTGSGSDASSEVGSGVFFTDGRGDGDGALLVNRLMQTTGSPSIYAAGDAAAVVWPELAREKERAADEAQPASLWFQMRLWNQARTQAIYAARSMLGALDPVLEASDGGLAFECFGHVTRFMGFKCVLLGLYNGQQQGLKGAHAKALQRLQVVPASSSSASSSASATTTTAGELSAAEGPQRLILAGQSVLETLHQARQPYPAADPAADPAAGAGAGPGPRIPVQVQIRVTPGVEYIKLVLFGDRLIGAMLIGETDLEETCENLILNRLSLKGHYTANTSSGNPEEKGTEMGMGMRLLDLLDPSVDVEDFFD